MDYGLHGTCMPLLAIVSRESSRSLAQDGVWLYLVLVRPGYMIVIRTSTDGVFKRIMNCSDPFFLPGSIAMRPKHWNKTICNHMKVGKGLRALIHRQLLKRSCA